jgi:hypothetical protein
MIRIMSSHSSLLRARCLLDGLLTDLDAGKPEAEIAAEIAAVPRSDLLRVRRLIDQNLTPNVSPIPIEVVRGGQPFREWLTDKVDLDHQRASRLLVFIDEYGASAASRGIRPTIPQLATDTEQSVATVNRRLSEFRQEFPGERDPLRVARALRRGLDQSSLWDSIHESIEATIGDVPVVQTLSESNYLSRQNKPDDTVS